MNRYRLIINSAISGVLLSMAWFEWCSGLVILIAFVPLLWVEDHIYKNKYSADKVFLYASISFSLWNFITTWWIYNASPAGMFVAVLINTFLMSTVFWIFHFCKKIIGSRYGYFGLIVFWISFEHFYLNAEISWPWLNLGNAFAKDIRIVQWYEYTGALGGTLWILIVNILIYNILKSYLKYRNLKHDKSLIYIISALILIPVISSIYRFNTYKEEKKPYNIIIVQPNVDPYKKFVNYSHKQQTKMLLNIAKPYLNGSTDYIVCPETAITSYSDIEKLDKNYYLNIIRHFLVDYPKTKIILGMTLLQNYYNKDEITPTAQQYESSNIYYDTYNSAVQIDTSDYTQFYHKSMLVVGVEKMPYPKALKLLRELTLKLGGTFRSHGTQKERTNLVSPQDSIMVAPVICYENVFGKFVTDYIKKGANFIFVITNEGWWGNTPGHRQLNHLSRLRAIETRRCVARSANTGISSFINQRGEILQFLGWWEQGALNGILNANDRITFYVRYGDYIAGIAYFFAGIIIIFTSIKYIINKNFKKIFNWK